IDHGLYFARGDVLTGTADHVFYAADDIKVAALILPEQVTGTKPIAVEGRRRRFGILVVALQHAGAANLQLSYLARSRECAALFHDARLAKRPGAAARAGADHVGGLDRHKEAGPGFRHAEGLASEQIEALFNHLMQMLGHAVDVHLDDLVARIV